jgi:uncharacterized protein (TIGR02145 family)
MRKLPSYALPLGTSLAFALLALACGSDSSSGSSKVSPENIFDSEDDLPECSDSLGLDSAYVGADSALYICEDGTWTSDGESTSDGEESSSSSEKSSDKSSSSTSKDGSSSSVNGSSSSGENGSSSSSGKAESSSSSNTSKADTLYVCKDHVNDISIVLENDTLTFKTLTSEGLETWEELESACSQIEAAFRNMTELDFYEYTGDYTVTKMFMTSEWDVVCDSSTLYSGFSYRLPDSDENRDLITATRASKANVSTADFDNSDCVGGSIQHCSSSDSIFILNYKYPEDSLTLELQMFLESDNITASREKFKKTAKLIEEAAAESNTAQLASLMDVPESSPWVSLFNGGVKISWVSGEQESSSYTTFKEKFLIAVKGYDKHIFAEALREDGKCTLTDDSWIGKLYSSSSISYGTLTDTRNGTTQTYKTVVIGTQTWMAENLNYAYPKESADATDSLSFCYDNDPANCETYGRLYTWAAAMDSAGLASDDAANANKCGYGTTCDASSPVRGVCPSGWHLPDTTEWSTLATYVAENSSDVGKALRSTSGWSGNGNGSDAFGFRILPAGSFFSNNYGNIETFAYFWASTESSENKYQAYRRYMNSISGLTQGANFKKYGHSVRCIKD